MNNRISPKDNATSGQPLRAPAVVLFGWLLSVSILFSEDEWKPVESAQLSMKEAVVEKGSPAEIIFWEIDVDDSGSKTVLRNYIRIKVFTPDGAETQSKKEIGYWEGDDVRDIAARTIKPDGTIIDMPASSILEKKVLRVGKFRRKAKTFVLPAVGPGCVIEYRWREDQRSTGSFRVNLQSDIPIQLLTCSVKALPDLLESTFNVDADMVRDAKGRWGRTLTRIPAVKAEPFMPPTDAVRSWSLFYYDRLWRASIAKLVHEANEPQMKVNDAVRQTSRDLIGKATDPDEQLRLLFEFCRDKIRRVDEDTPDVKADEIAGFKKNKVPSDTLKQKMGTGTDANLLFAALAAAAGFTSRISMVTDRSDMLYGPTATGDPLIPYILTARHIAVFVDGAWRFFDPASTHIPYGMLRWQEEGENALVCDPDKPAIVVTPMSPPEKSLILRQAALKLLEDGTLEGEARVEAVGQTAASWRESERSLSVEEREKKIVDAFKKRMATAEISGVHFANLDDADKPYVYRYVFRIPGYAQRTGNRLILQPALFEREKDQLFTSNEARRHPVYFPYPWSEHDFVTIDLPPGYQLDNADAPSAFAVGKDCSYSPKLSVTPDGRTLVYERQFSLGASGNIIFPASNYPLIKKVFDHLHSQDNHTVSLKRTQGSSK